MSGFIPLPTPDPMPLPGPVWLMMTLLLITFLLHLIAMNLALGGTAIAVFCATRRKTDRFAGQLATDLLQVLPTCLAFAITLGVAALLFVQVLYGNLLYASSILIGVFWIAVIPTLIVAYYGLYYSKSRPTSAGACWISLFLLLAIGFVYVNNFTLMLTPQRWLAMYRSSTAGLNLNWTDSSLAPRYLHFILGAFASAGLLIFVVGVWKRSTEYGQWMMQNGSRWFVVPTVLNFLVGMWFLMSLPRSVLLDLFAGSVLGASLIGLGMLLPLAAIAHVVLAPRTEKTLLHARLATVTTLLTLILMVAIRQVVRGVYLESFVHLRDLPVSAQWSVIGLFVLLFVAGLATLYIMLKKLWSAEGVHSAVSSTAAGT